MFLVSKAVECSEMCEKINQIFLTKVRYEVSVTKNLQEKQIGILFWKLKKIFFFEIRKSDFFLASNLEHSRQKKYAFTYEGKKV